MVITGVAYISVSLLASRKPFNMDRMLHRGAYAIKGDVTDARPKTGWNALKMTPEFARDDKVIYLISLFYIFASFTVFLAITILFVVFQKEFSGVFWGKFWWGYSALMLGVSTVLAVWFATGGFKDLASLLRTLAKAKRDADDDGTVVGGQSLADVHGSNPESEA